MCCNDYLRKMLALVILPRIKTIEASNDINFTSILASIRFFEPSLY